MPLVYMKWTQPISLSDLEYSHFTSFNPPDPIHLLPFIFCLAALYVVCGPWEAPLSLTDELNCSENLKEGCCREGV